MRISDWSSDVCSSDLFDLGAAARVEIDRQRHQRHPLAGDSAVQLVDLASVRGRAAVRIKRVQPRQPVPRARKSVVSGKSVAVRVDLGGRRSIKKKTKKTKNSEVTYSRNNIQKG